MRPHFLAAGLTVVFMSACTCSGNLFINGSFEVGLQGWACYTRGVNYPEDVRILGLDPQPEWAEVPDAPHGQRVLRFEAPQGCGFRISSRAFAAKPGTLQFSFSARGDFPVTVQVVDAGKYRDNVLAEVKVEPSADWRRHETEVAIPDGTEHVAIAIGGTGPGRVELDHFRLQEPGAETTQRVDVGLVALPGQILFDNQQAAIIARVFAPKDLPGTAVRYRVENAWGQELALGTSPAELRASELAEIRLPVELPGTGLYHVYAEVMAGQNRLSATEELLLAVVPARELPTSSADADASRFGCNMEERPWLLRLAQTIGIRWVYCAPPLFTKWFSAEPRPGEWRFYDDSVERFERAGIRVVGNLADPPTWATHPGSEDYGGPWPNPNYPTDWALWDEYVRRVAEHYRPHITHWGLWNEPNHPGYLQAAEGSNWVDEYMVMLERTYRVLKEVDENLFLVGGTVTHAGGLVPLLSRNGALGLMDAAAFHYASWTPDGYVRYTVEGTGLLGPREAVNYIGRLKEIMAEKGKTLPLWDTECHMTEADVETEFKTQPNPPKAYETPRMTPIDAANAVVRCFVGEWAAGVDRTFYWLLATGESSWEPRTAKTLIEWDRSPTAALVAFAVMTDKLAGAELLDWEAKSDATMLPGTTIWFFRFRKPGGRLTVTWSNRDEETEITVPVRGDGVKVWDMFGREMRGAGSMSGVPLQGRVLLRLTRSPVYIFEPGD